MAFFIITEKSIKKLKEQEVPSDVIELLNDIKNEVIDEDNFIELLKEKIGYNLAEKYQLLILKTVHRSIFKDKITSLKEQNIDPIIKLKQIALRVSVFCFKDIEQFLKTKAEKDLISKVITKMVENGVLIKEKSKKDEAYYSLNNDPKKIANILRSVRFYYTLEDLIFDCNSILKQRTLKIRTYLEHKDYKDRFWYEGDNFDAFFEKVIKYIDRKNEDILKYDELGKDIFNIFLKTMVGNCKENSYKNEVTKDVWSSLIFYSSE